MYDLGYYDYGWWAVLDAAGCRFVVERMDQNEEIFVRFMNDAPFQKIVTAWMASETYRRLRSDVGGTATGEGHADGTGTG